MDWARETGDRCVCYVLVLFLFVLLSLLSSFVVYVLLVVILESSPSQQHSRAADAKNK